MKTRKIVKVEPPERQVLQGDPAAIRQARLQRKWGRFNRLTIADILGRLREIQLASDNKSHVKEVTSGLFDIIKQARNILLTLTDSPGIISQSALAEFCLVRDDETVHHRRLPGTFTYLKDKLDIQFEGGWLIEPGDCFIKREKPSKGGFIVMGRASERNPFQQARQSRPTTEQKGSGQASALQGGLKVETPTPAQIQAWFDLPS